MLYYLFDITVTVEANEIKETYTDAFSRNSPTAQGKKLSKPPRKILWIMLLTTTATYSAALTLTLRLMYKQTSMHINSQKKNIIIFSQNIKIGSNPLLFYRIFRL